MNSRILEKIKNDELLDKSEIISLLSLENISDKYY